MEDALGCQKLLCDDMQEEFKAMMATLGAEASKINLVFQINVQKLNTLN